MGMKTTIDLLNCWIVQSTCTQAEYVGAQKRPDRSWKTWDEVLVNDRKKLGMYFADPQNCDDSGEDSFEEDLSNKPNPR